MSGSPNELGGIPVVDIPPALPSPAGFRKAVIGCLALALAPPLLLALTLAWYFLAPQKDELPGSTTTIETVAAEKVKPSVEVDSWGIPGFRAARNGVSHAFYPDWSETPTRYYVQALDATGQELWARGVVGKDDDDDNRRISLASLPDGGCYAAVAFTSPIETYEVNGEAQPLSPSEEGSVLLIKLGPKGEWQWQMQFSTTGPIRLDEIIAASDGSCVLLGNAPESITVPSSVEKESKTSVFEGAKPGGFLVHFTPSGALSSLVRVSLNGEYCAFEIASDGSYTIHAVGEKSLRAMRMKPDGTLMWNKSVMRFKQPPPSTCYDYGADGSVVFGTQFDETLTLDPEDPSPTQILPAERNSYDFVVVRVDCDGKVSWSRQIGPLAGSIFAEMTPSVQSDICAFDDGSCMVLSTFSGTIAIPDTNAVHGKVAFRGAGDAMLAIHIGADGAITNVSRLAHGHGPFYASIHNIGAQREALILGVARRSVTFEPGHVRDPQGKSMTFDEKASTPLFFWSKIVDRPMASEAPVTQ